jgi:uncharacterized protein (TIGR03437 family)
MIRLVIAFLCAAVACMLIAGALTSAQSPSSSTPDPFVTQVTSSVRSSATNPVNSFAGDITANGRFVVIESNGDIATEKTTTRNNQDGNREIFLFDYAQRRIFQLTDTKSVLNPPGSPSPTPSPSPSPSVSPSPTASPTATPVELTDVAIEVSNNRPMISLEPALVTGQRTYTIVFSSNAPVSPASFDGTNPGGTVATDMNQEIWTYQFTVADTADLSSGAEVGPIDLTAGTFTRITNTPASLPPIAGSANNAPVVADDNRDASISDDGKIIAFSSNRNLVPGVGNLDTDGVPAGVANPEIFLYNGAGFIQATNTKSTSLKKPIFNSNPSLSSNGSVLAFVSNANLTANNDDGNAEIYLANFSGSAISGLRQVTKTKDAVDSSGNVIATTTFFSFGRRLSRDGRFLAFETLAADPAANAAPTAFSAAFVYDVTAGTFAQLGPRPLSAPGDIFHFPTFTDYDGALNPKSVVFTSALNFKSDGTFPAADQDSTGLNPLPTGQTLRPAQLFLAPLPVTSTGPFTRITNLPTFGGLRGLISATRTRFAFSLTAEIGGGNSDLSSEVFYQLLPAATTESAGSISLFTKASLIPVASPTASPVPTSSPFVAPGLAPGELAVAQFTLTPAPLPASVSFGSASESTRSPALPIELRGTSIAINGAACGIYLVTATSIDFVVPIGLVPNTGTASYPVVINSNGTVIRGQVVIVSAQPDIFTSTGGSGGRAVVCNVTNATCLIEPFNVTSDNGTGTLVPTVLEIHLTGILRGTAAAAVTVTIGTTVIVPTNVIQLDQPGFQEIDITLPSTVDRGDLPIVVKVGTATSRPTDSAPHVTINP